MIELANCVVYCSLPKGNVDCSNRSIVNSTGECRWPQFPQLRGLTCDPVVAGVRRNYRDLALIDGVADLERHPIGVEARGGADYKHHIFRLV